MSTPRKALFTLTTLGLIAVTAHPASAQTVITGLFDTGVNAVGVSQANGTIGDSHYTLVSVPTNSTTQTLTRTSVGGYPIPPYIGDSPTSAWIGPNNGSFGNDLAGPAGMYDYQTTFTVLSLGTPSSTAIAGQWATDNLGGDILINGASTGITSSGFTDYTNFTISSTDLKLGTNTLDFLVNNLPRNPADGNPNDNPTALRVNDLSAAPEPSQVGMLALVVLGLGALAFKARKRSTATQTA